MSSCHIYFVLAVFYVQLQFMCFFFHRLSSIFLQHCHCQHPLHEWCTSVLVVTPLALIYKVQCIIHLNNKEYLIKTLCDFIFLSILQIWQEQSNQVFVQKQGNAVHLHDLNNLLNVKSPLNKWLKFLTPPTPIPPVICVSKYMPKIYLRHVK